MNKIITILFVLFFISCKQHNIKRKCCDSPPIKETFSGGYLGIPNIFTPNGDGMNDKFVIRNPDGKQIALEVYNRWGNRVYKSVDYQNDWGGEVTEGFFVGRDIPDGTYYYIIIIGESDKYVGFITINR